MKKILALICIAISLVLLISCESIYGDPIVEIGRIAAKEDTIIYVQEEMTEVFGDNAANTTAGIINAHGIPVEIVQDVDYIPTYSTENYAGTCFSIAPHYAITNAHVVDLGTIEIAVDGTAYPATVVSIDPESDVALLYIPDYAFPFSFDLQTDEIYELAESVYAIGYPITDLLNLDPRITQGIINAKSGFDGDNNEIQISAQIQPGNSGGPLLRENDFTKVIGVTSSSVSDIATLATSGTVMQNVNFAIKSMVANQALPEVSEIDKENNPYPSSLEEATQATAYVMATYTPVSPYIKRLLLVANTETTRTLNITDFGSWYSYRTLVNLKFFDVDTGNLDSWVIQTYGTGDSHVAIAYAIEDYCKAIYGDEKQL